MIAVIADDFTGAAELAGIGLRYDLKVELATSVIADPGADMFVVCTDSRSMGKAEAIKITGDTIKEILELSPGFIYKKIDSVLRGHVLDELKTQMQKSGKTKALLLGANPSLGRAITGGRYFINGEPIDETDFGSDPEFAIRDSSVLEMVKAAAGEAKVLKHTDSLPASGIVIGEAVSAEDVKAWAHKVDDSWMLAGAGDFFAALLDIRFKARTKPPVLLQSPHLYVSGTAFGKSREFVKGIQQHLNCVAYVPHMMMLTGNTDNKNWYDRITGLLTTQNKAVIAIDDEDVDPWSVSALHLRTIMAVAVRTIIEKGMVKELFIEGGSTAAAILKELGIKKLSLVNELQRGIVRMKANELYITVKPGSYQLPEQINELYST